jgi:hypothetical protein
MLDVSFPRVRASIAAAKGRLGKRKSIEVASSSSTQVRMVEFLVRKKRPTFAERGNPVRGVAGPDGDAPDVPSLKSKCQTYPFGRSLLFHAPLDNSLEKNGLVGVLSFGTFDRKRHG